MKRIAKFAWPLLLAALAVAAAGCRETKVPQSDLDRFVDGIRDLPQPAAMDTLRAIADRGGERATFAQYELGNRYYSAAEDTAKARGWNDAAAKALLDSSETWFLKSVAADSTFVEGWVNLGGVWDTRSDMMAPQKERDARVEQAATMYNHALELRPDDEKARCNLGALYLRQRETEKAKDEFMKVLDRDPKSALGHYHLAVMFAEARIYREAEREWKLAVKYDPDGDVGERSQANLKILDDLQKAPAQPATQ